MSTVHITNLELNVADNKLLISARANEAYLNGVMHLDNEDTFVCTNEHSPNAITINIDTSLESVLKDSEDNVIGLLNYEVDLTNLANTSPMDLDIHKHLFFVYIDFISDDPTDEIVYTVVGMIFYENSLYRLVFRNIHESLMSEDCCKVNKNAMNEALLFEAFQLSRATADPRKFIYYWNLLHKANTVPSSNCSCNG